MDRSCHRFALLAASLALVLSFSPTGRASETARLATYVHEGGESYFALALAPEIDLPTPTPAAIVVLFDTSASQTGIYRDEALETLKTLLDQLEDADRIQLVAIDLDPVAMGESLVAPRGEAANASIKQLESRVPLGATDLVAGLEFARGILVKSRLRRQVIYIGDGMSRSRILDEKSMTKLQQSLVADRISVSSYCTGPQRDAELLAILANATGGLLFVDMEERSAQQTGAALARGTRGDVIWPTDYKQPESVRELLPARFPPLRFDRDSIVIGVLGERIPLHLELQAELAGKPVDLKWDVEPEPGNDDFNFLRELVTKARKNDGVMLPTAGSAALREAGRIISMSAESLLDLAKRSLAGDDLESAARLVEEILKRDPGHLQASDMRKSIEKKRRDAAKQRPTQKKGAASGGSRSDKSRVPSPKPPSERPIPDKSRSGNQGAGKRDPG